MLGKATFCLKVVPSQARAYFFYIDASSEEEALKNTLKKVNQETEARGRDIADDFVQVGVFFTDHVLHQLARGTYVGSK